MLLELVLVLLELVLVLPELELLDVDDELEELELDERLFVGAPLSLESFELQAATRKEHINANKILGTRSSPGWSDRSGQCPEVVLFITNMLRLSMPKVRTKPTICCVYHV